MGQEHGQDQGQGFRIIGRRATTVRSARRQQARLAIAAAWLAVALIVAAPPGVRGEDSNRDHDVDPVSGSALAVGPRGEAHLSTASLAAAERAPSDQAGAAEPGRGDAGATDAQAPAVDTSVRVWPLVIGTYWFSQVYGCVPQLGYYPEIAGCPPAAPGFHDGIDLAAPAGTIIYAPASGTVVAAGFDRPGSPANTWLMIQHDGTNAGWSTEFYHWQTAYVQAGDDVVAGQPIAEVGAVGFATGPHLHFSVIDAAGVRIDPLAWLPADPAVGP